MSKIITSKKRIVASLSECAIRQSPYIIPDNLEKVLLKADELLSFEFKEEFTEFSSFNNLRDYIKNTLSKIPELLLWNERKNGNKSGYGFISRYSKEDADNDFIDLDALYRNITASCTNDNL